MHYFVSNTMTIPMGKLEQDVLREEDSTRVWQNLSGASFPVQVHDDSTRSSISTEVVSRSRHDQLGQGSEGYWDNLKTLKAPQPIFGKLQKNRLCMLTHFHEELEIFFFSFFFLLFVIVFFIFFFVFFSIFFSVMLGV